MTDIARALLVSAFAQRLCQLVRRLQTDSPQLPCRNARSAAKGISQFDMRARPGSRRTGHVTGAACIDCLLFWRRAVRRRAGRLRSIAESTASRFRRSRGWTFDDTATGREMPKRLFSGQLCRSVGRQPVDLNAAQQTAALEYEYSGQRIDWAENEVPEDVYARWCRFAALDLEIDGPTAARTARRRYLGRCELFEKLLRLWLAMLKHPTSERHLGCRQRAVSFESVHGEKV